MHTPELSQAYPGIPGGRPQDPGGFSSRIRPPPRPSRPPPASWRRRFAAGNKAISCGNGGSACDAIHFAEEFTGRFIKDRKPLPAIPLTDPGHLTCVGNDYGYDEVFARGVSAYGKPGDVLVAISTSGNSRNVIRAVEEARKGDQGDPPAGQVRAGAC